MDLFYISEINLLAITSVFFLFGVILGYLYHYIKALKTQDTFIDEILEELELFNDNFLDVFLKMLGYNAEDLNFHSEKELIDLSELDKESIKK